MHRYYIYVACIRIKLLNAFKRFSSHLCHDEENKISIILLTFSFLLNTGSLIYQQLSLFNHKFIMIIIVLLLLINIIIISIFTRAPENGIFKNTG